LGSIANSEHIFERFESFVIRHPRLRGINRWIPTAMTSSGHKA
jgi:hypothetical protein